MALMRGGLDEWGQGLCFERAQYLGEWSSIRYGHGVSGALWMVQGCALVRDCKRSLYYTTQMLPRPYMVRFGRNEIGATAASTAEVSGCAQRSSVLALSPKTTLLVRLSESRPEECKVPSAENLPEAKSKYRDSSRNPQTISTKSRL